MPAKLRKLNPPTFGLSATRPTIPAQTYEARVAAAVAGADVDWLVVYADREHFGNMVFLSGFEPRFEEALLLLGRKGQRVLLTGNESQSYTAAALHLPSTTVLRSQSLSLMAQDRTSEPRLHDQLVNAGLGRGDSVGVIGWKYLEPEEDDQFDNSFYIPHAHAQILRRVVGDAGKLVDATHILMHPERGLRANVDADAIAQAEWGAARASRAVWNVVSGIRLGDSELQAMARMGFEGEAFNVHPMFASSSAGADVIGLRSATTRKPRPGDGVTTAVGYFGGLSSRAGLFREEDSAFVEVAAAYFEGLQAWYAAAGVGASGGDVCHAVVEQLARGNLRSALNPGHLTDAEEWFHSPIRPQSKDRLRSGMLLQVDVIPTPLPSGQALNCEDSVALADAALFADLRDKHPDVAGRVLQRRQFMRDQLGVEIADDILPLSDIPAYLPPLWLNPTSVLVRE